MILVFHVAALPARPIMVKSYVHKQNQAPTHATIIRLHTRTYASNQRSTLLESYTYLSAIQ